MEINNSTISVVMCAYTSKRWPDMIRAVSSLQQQTIPADEIILVIDHNPKLLERSQKTFQGINVIENTEQPGLSGARNSGLAHAQSEIIAFIDEDAVASSNWIESLLSVYDDDKAVGTGGEVKPLWTANFPRWLPEEFNWVVGCSYKGLPGSLAPIRNPIGCNMSFRKEALLAAGGFRNGMGRIGTLPVGCEETELSIRLHQLYPEARILYQPSAIVYHRVPEWRTTWSYFTRRCFAEGLSKAQVTHFVGSNDGLSSERSYATITLPQGVACGIKQTITQGDLDGLKHALAIAAGFSLTSLGYLAGISLRIVRNQKLAPVDTLTMHDNMVANES